MRPGELEAVFDIIIVSKKAATLMSCNNLLIIIIILVVRAALRKTMSMRTFAKDASGLKSGGV
jgi:hypothetical protein